MVDASEPQNNFWKKCSSCRKEIPFGAQYYRCSVSTCQHERTGFRFCSVQCWDAHLGYTNHRSAFAEEAHAPGRAELSQAVAAPERAPQRKIVEQKSASAPVAAPVQGLPQTETLVVVSKVKQLIREQTGFNTSECCVDALTKKVVQECLKGIAHARAAGRKTVMGRDIL